MPGGAPLWPGKPPNPGGRPKGAAIRKVSPVSIDRSFAAGTPTSIGIVRHPVQTW